MELIYVHINIVDRKSFTGLNFRGFDPMKYFMKYFRGSLVRSAYVILIIIKEALV